MTAVLVRVALLISLICFVVALLITTATLGGDFHPWVDGGFVALVFSLLIER